MSRDAAQKDACRGRGIRPQALPPARTALLVPQGPPGRGRGSRPARRHTTLPGPLARGRVFRLWSPPQVGGCAASVRGQYPAQVTR